ncbi:hypothetical protein VXS03_07050 [Photobacterium sp. S4TG1]|uniref:hypothetical protein n=1 Tax=Photobacterium sp. S4TG1 TaxID=3114587 RepID=UPI002E19B749|nr:hypothetical protein [Photobacterium sp. S4TG1]
MNTDIIERAKTFYQYFSANGLIDLIILGLATISANFLAYIYYFDINALVFVDASTITKHVLVISLHYAGALAVISITLVIAQNLITSREFLNSMGRVGPIGIDLGSLFPRTVRFSLWSILDRRILRTVLTVVLFSMVYIGSINAIILIIVTTILIVFISFLYLRFWGELEDVEDTKTVLLFGGYIRMEVLSISITEELKKETGNYLLAKVGVILLYLALSIGIGRANYIEDEMQASLDGMSSNVAVITSSSFGLLLYDLNEKFVFFKPWNNIDNLFLPKDNQKSLKTLQSIN